ncbi:MAG: hypothetical protein H7069_00510 [Phormidesmis sp. FL-bin-119]|nr:hypothetical protein [Pedobacter sp.]
MKSKIVIKGKVTIENRKAWGRLDENTKSKILKELKSGLIGQREANRIYGIPRTTIIHWQGKDNLVTLLNASFIFHAIVLKIIRSGIRTCVKAANIQDFA